MQWRRRISILPLRFDFISMFEEQSGLLVQGLGILLDWLRGKEGVAIASLVEVDSKSDALRQDVEHKLLLAFYTPADRRDLFVLSQNIAYILSLSRQVAVEMEAYGVKPDKTVETMAEILLEGGKDLQGAFKLMREQGKGSQAAVHKIRTNLLNLEKVYVETMAELFKTKQPMVAMSKMEIYHHVRGAGMALRDTVDALQRIVLDLE